MFLIIANSYSKWIETHPMSDIKTSSTLQYLGMSFSNHGVPFILVTDNGPSFTGNDFKLNTTKNGIKHVTTAPYHLSSNGPTEQPVWKKILRMDQ